MKFMTYLAEQRDIYWKIHLEEVQSFIESFISIVSEERGYSDEYISIGLKVFIPKKEDRFDLDIIYLQDDEIIDGEKIDEYLNEEEIVYVVRRLAPVLINGGFELTLLKDEIEGDGYLLKARIQL